jgi:hypothetical protein
MGETFVRPGASLRPKLTTASSDYEGSSPLAKTDATANAIIALKLQYRLASRQAPKRGRCFMESHPSVG